MSAPALFDANKIIEDELKQARRTILEEWYRDHPADLVEDSECDIDIKDKRDVENQLADFVGGMSDEEIEERLNEGII